MDISLQTRLLRVLETGQFMKIGKGCLVVTEGGNTGLSISAVADAGII